MAEKSDPKKIVFQNSDSQKLYDFLVEQLGAVNRRFDGVDKRFEVIETDLADFKKQYVADYKDLVELISDQLEKKADKTDIEMVLSKIAQLSDKVDDYRAEQIGLKKQVDKHEKWHFQTAAKVGIELK